MMECGVVIIGFKASGSMGNGKIPENGKLPENRNPGRLLRIKESKFFDPIKSMFHYRMSNSGVKKVTVCDLYISLSSILT